MQARAMAFSRAREAADVFVHHSAIQTEGYRTLAEGQRVEFEVEQGPKGAKANHVIAL